MSSTCLGLLCGVPASGKSTLAVRIEEYAAQHLPRELRVLVLRYDRLIPSQLEQQLIAQTDEQGGSLWKSMRSQIIMCLDDLLNVLKHGQKALTELIHTYGYDGIKTHSTELCVGEGQADDLDKPSGVDAAVWERWVSLLGDCVKNASCERRHEGDSICWLVLVDDNMHYSSMRYQYCQLARKYDAGLCILNVSCPLEEALQRNRSRTEDRVGDNIITLMHQRMETPDPDKRPWEKYSATVSGTSVFDVQRVVELVQQALRDPQRPCPEEDTEGKVISRYICSTNAIHQADQILRRCVSLHMAEAKGAGLSSEEMKTMSAEMMKLRTTILSDLRQGKVTLPFQVNEADVSDASKNTDNPLFQFVQGLFSVRAKECL
ncbi:hypothetical protein ACOMHN_035825 [Nucella lapillus]